MNKIYLVYLVLILIVLYLVYDTFFNKRKKLVRIVLKDLERYGGINETDSRIYEFLVPAWNSTAEYSSVDINNIMNIDNEKPWSAAFISYEMQKTGIKDFPASARHSVYIVAARDKRLRNIGDTKLELYRVNEFKPRIGDLVAVSRSGSSVNYDTVKVGDATHVDIVVGIENDRIITVGGNVGDTIAKTEYRTENGFIVNNKNFIGVIKNRHF